MPEHTPVTNFGAETWRLRAQLVEGIRRTHSRHVEAQTVSGQAGERVYAQVWSALPAECLRVVSENWVNSTSVQPGRAGYRLPVLNNTIIFPWRPPAGGDPQTTPFVTSPSRGSLFTTSPSPQGMLDLEDAASESSVSDEADVEGTLHGVMELAATERLAVVVVAVVSSAANLWAIVWGEVGPKADGSGLLEFSSYEELYTHESEQLASEVAEIERSFDAGEAPRPIIKRRSAKNE